MAFPDEEMRIYQNISEVYNSGEALKSVEMSEKFLADYPESPLAKYKYAVMYGDYSVTPGLSIEDKEKFLDIAKRGVKELLESPDFSKWPKRFQNSVRNEYYWFYEMPEEQYKLGLEKIDSDDSGEYSACVGASMMALRVLKEGKKEVADDWAEKSLHYFKIFETYAPDWYNINFFAAQAEAVLGRYEDSRKTISKMFKKQGKPEDPDYVKEFEEKIELINSYKR